MYTKAIGVVDVSCISWVTNWMKDDLHWSDLFLNFHGSIAACFNAVFFTCLPWTINRECSTCDNFVNCRNIFIWCRMPVTLNHAPDTQTNTNIKTGVTERRPTSVRAEQRVALCKAPARLPRPGLDPHHLSRLRYSLLGFSWFLSLSILKKNLLRYFMYIKTICTFCCVYF